MSWYIATRGLYDIYSVYNADYITLVNCINIGRSSIVGLTEHPKYHEHWVVGYGYRYMNFASENDCYVTVNDGWGENNVEVNWSYVDHLVFFNKLA